MPDDVHENLILVYLHSMFLFPLIISFSYLIPLTILFNY